MTRRTWTVRLTAALLAVAALTAPARAGLLPLSVTITPEAGNFRWTYAIVLPTDMQLQSGNYFTIYDFAGYIPGGEMAPAGWSLTADKTGTTPDLLNPDDDPNMWNLTWKYTGATIPSGQIGLGNFWAYSQFGDKGEDYFTAQTNRTSDGELDRNITITVIPTGTSTPVDVPEPATLALAALGLPLVGLARRRRAAKNA